MTTLKKYFAFNLAAVMAAIVLYGDDCRCQTSFKDRIHLKVGAGWGSYSMKRGYIEKDSGDKTVFNEYYLKRIEGGREYHGEIIFDYSKHFSIGLGILYSDGSRNLSEWVDNFPDDYYPPPKPDPVIIEASLTSPYLNLRYGSDFENVNYSVNADIYYGFAGLNADVLLDDLPPPIITYERIRYNSSGAGYSLSAGISFRLADGLFFVNNAGYRGMSIGDLEDSDGNNLTNYRLNYSGYFIWAGLSINPWSI